MKAADTPELITALASLLNELGSREDVLAVTLNDSFESEHGYALAVFGTGGQRVFVRFVDGEWVVVTEPWRELGEDS